MPLDCADNRPDLMHLNKHVIKRKNDGVDTARHTLECPKRGIKRNDPRLVERYLKMQTQILLKFRMGKSVELLACLQRDRLRKAENETAEVRRGCARTVAPPKDLEEFGSFGWHYTARMKR